MIKDVFVKKYMRQIGITVIVLGFFATCIFGSISYASEGSQSDTFENQFPYQPIPKEALEFEQIGDRNVYSDKSIEFLREYFKGLLVLPREFLKDDFAGHEISYSKGHYTNIYSETMLSPMFSNEVREMICEAQEEDPLAKYNSETFCQLDPYLIYGPGQDGQQQYFDDVICAVEGEDEFALFTSTDALFLFPLLVDPQPKKKEDIPNCYKYGCRGYQFRVSTFYNQDHLGVDYIFPAGTPIVASSSGEIEFAGPDTRSGYGNYVKVNHIFPNNEKYQTRYAHMSKIFVKKGEFVNIGQIIGEVGSTGLSTANHIHYEVLKCVNNDNLSSCSPDSSYSGNYADGRIDPESLMYFDIREALLVNKNIDYKCSQIDHTNTQGDTTTPTGSTVPSFDSELEDTFKLLSEKIKEKYPGECVPWIMIESIMFTEISAKYKAEDLMGEFYKENTTLCKPVNEACAGESTGPIEIQSYEDDEQASLDMARIRQEESKCTGNQTKLLELVGNNKDDPCYHERFGKFENRTKPITVSCCDDRGPMQFTATTWTGANYQKNPMLAEISKEILTEYGYTIEGEYKPLRTRLIDAIVASSIHLKTDCNKWEEDEEGTVRWIASVYNGTRNPDSAYSTSVWNKYEHRKENQTVQYNKKTLNSPIKLGTCPAMNSEPLGDYNGDPRQVINQCADKTDRSGRAYPTVPYNIINDLSPPDPLSCNSPENFNRFYGTGNDADVKNNETLQSNIKPFVDSQLVPVRFLNMNIRIHKHVADLYKSISDEIESRATHIEGTTYKFERPGGEYDSYAFCSHGTFNARGNKNACAKWENKKCVEPMFLASPHSFGVAIDLNSGYSGCYEKIDPTLEKDPNYGGNPNKAGCVLDLPVEVVEAFVNHGCTWGGWWDDGMHFECNMACNTDCNPNYTKNE
jgi:hypothetical protein